MEEVMDDKIVYSDGDRYAGFFLLLIIAGALVGTLLHYIWPI
jgi:hypothetical protein